MTFQFDHFIHFVNSPEKALEAYSALDLHAVEGGRHESHGTFNALSYFGLSYVELIGVFNKTALTDVSEDYSLRKTIIESNFEEGGARIALRSENLLADAERFRKLGLDVVGPTDLSRRRPDGSLISWQLLFVGKQEEYPELPFFIQWDESDEERLIDLTKRGTIADHPLGEVSLSAVGVAVKDISTVTEKWSKYLQLEIGDSFVDDSLNAKAQILRLQGGDIVFYEPLGTGKVKEILDTRGEKPFLLELTNNQEEKEIDVFGAIYRFKK